MSIGELLIIHPGYWAEYEGTRTYQLPIVAITAIGQNQYAACVFDRHGKIVMADTLKGFKGMSLNPRGLKWPDKVIDP